LRHDGSFRSIIPRQAQDEVLFVAATNPFSSS